MIKVPSFHFAAVHLPAVVDELERRFGSAREALLNQGAETVDLQPLLERIRQVPVAELEELAASLLNREVRALVRHLPELPVDELSQRVRVVIGLRWLSGFAGTLWSGLHRRPDQRDLHLLLAEAIRRGEDDFFTGEPGLLSAVQEYLESGTFVASLGGRLAKGDAPFAEQAVRFGIRPETELLRRLWKACLLAGDRQTFVREDGTVLVRALDLFRPDEIPAVVDRYLRHVPLEECAEAVMRAIRRRVGVPYEHERLNPRWEAVGEEQREKFQQWWMRREIDKFFNHDNERHQFWIRYVPHMRRIDRAPRVGALVMWFPRVVVVEFAAVGNAAYGYRPEVFAQAFGRFGDLRNVVNHSSLKDRDLAEFRVKHHQGWRREAGWILRRYLS